MSCEGKDLNKIRRGELEMDIRFHVWQSIRGEGRLVNESEVRLKELENNFIERFGGTAWVLFTNQIMKKDKEIFGE